MLGKVIEEIHDDIRETFAGDCCEISNENVRKYNGLFYMMRRLITCARAGS